MKKRVLILYATYGSGHKTVAQYLENYFLENNKEIEIKCMDILDYANVTGKISKVLFEFQIKYRTKIIFNAIYALFNNKVTTSPYKAVTRLFFNKNLKKVIKEFNPDLIISTIYFGSFIASILNQKNIIHSKSITIITDYTAHEAWIKNHKNEDAYIVGNEFVKNELLNKGVESKKIKVYGIPVSEKFKKVVDDKNEIMKKYKIENDRKTILFFGGGSQGSISYADYFKLLVKKEFFANIIFIAGNNKKLKDICDKYVKRKRISNTLVLGFTNDVPNLLSICDFVISKPGGITVTECLEMKKPMVLIPGNGGPEIENARLLLKKKYALKSFSPYGMIRKVKALLKKKNLLETLQNNLNNQEDKNSIKNIYDLSLRLLKKK